MTSRFFKNQILILFYGSQIFGILTAYSPAEFCYKALQIRCVEVRLNLATLYLALSKTCYISLICFAKKINFQETYDHDLLWKNRGQALITSQPAPPRRVCLLCGSRGHPDDKIDRLVHCCSCCESFHAYCADASYEHPLVKKAMETGSWFCKR